MTDKNPITQSIGMNPSKQTIADVAMIARNAIDRMIELESNKLDIQRPWVYLTDDEIKEIVGPYGDTPIKGYTRKLFDQIEAALRSKNT